MFLHNIGRLSRNDTALYLRRYGSLQPPLREPQIRHRLNCFVHFVFHVVYRVYQKDCWDFKHLQLSKGVGTCSVTVHSVSVTRVVCASQL
jgi:hypothetical protein